jgi:prophage regulatory protein
MSYEFTRPPSLLRLPQVKLRTGLSRTGIYREVAAGRLPKPIKRGNRPNSPSVWVSDDVDRYVMAVIAAAGARDD